MDNFKRARKRPWPLVAMFVAYLAMTIADSIVDRFVPANPGELYRVSKDTFGWVANNGLLVLTIGTGLVTLAAWRTLARRDDEGPIEKATKCGRVRVDVSQAASKQQLVFYYSVFNGNAKPVRLSLKKVHDVTYDGYHVLIFVDVSGLEKELPAYGDGRVSIALRFVGPSGDKLREDFEAGALKMVNWRGLEIYATDGERTAKLNTPSGATAMRKEFSWEPAEPLFLEGQ